MLSAPVEAEEAAAGATPEAGAEAAPEVEAEATKVGGIAAPKAGADETDVRYRDAHADRLILFPTADTHPEGTFYFTAYEIIFWQFGYAFTDSLQGTITTWPPIVKEQPLFLDLNLKLNLLNEDVRLALFGGSLIVSVEGNTGFAPRLGVASQFCFDEDCLGSVHAGLLGVIAVAEGESTEPGFVGSVGFRQRVGETISVVLELDGAAGGNNVDVADGVLVDYGLRFSGRQYAADIGFILPIGPGESPFILGVPWVSFTYRTAD